MNRSGNIKKVSLISIGVNVLLVLFKAAVGLISGSIAIIMDAVNNLADAMGSGITILGVVLAGRKPDSKHPFGYGRVEYLARRCALEQKGVTGFHGFFMDGDTVTFDIVAEFDCDIHAATQAIKAAIERQKPSAQVLIGIDKNYTE